MEWIRKNDDDTPEVGQLILLFWPAEIHPVSKKKSNAEVACMRYAESKFGPWYCEFLWGSGRFGHRSERFATHYMLLPPFPGPT